MYGHNGGHAREIYREGLEEGRSGENPHGGHAREIYREGLEEGLSGQNPHICDGEHRMGVRLCRKPMPSRDMGLASSKSPSLEAHKNSIFSRKF